MFPRHRSKFDSRVVREWSEPGGRAIDHTTRGARVSERGRERINAFEVRRRPRRRRAKAGSAFTLIELLVVMAIISILLLLMAPAFTTIKSGNEITSSAYMVKGMIEAARTYAKANNTYAWVGFYEEDGSVSSVIPAPDPCSGCTGRLVISAVASKDGTIIYDPNATGTGNFIDPTRLVQITKLMKIDSVHLPLFAASQVGSDTGDTFDTRPPVQNDGGGVGYNASRFGEINAGVPNTAPYDPINSGNTKFPFQYPVGNPVPSWQYRFRKTLQFSPNGDNRINSTYDLRRIVEIGLIQARGNIVPPPVGGAYPGNLVAVQTTGIGGNVRIYRR